MPTYPLPTLAATLGPAGVTAPTFNDILQSLLASVKLIFGSDSYLTPDTQDYQMLAMYALGMSDGNQADIAVFNSFRPDYAQGIGLSTIVKLNGIQRESSTNSTVILAITGQATSVLDNAVVQDGNNNLWNLPAEVIIPAGGVIMVTATAQQAGAITAGANTISKIYTPQFGWQTANNPFAAVPGASIESDATLRKRQAASTAIPAQTPLQSILAAVANVPGVDRSQIYQNDTGSTDVNGIPGHSISVIAEGGDITAIATAIERKKAPGTGTYGSTSVIVTDPAGLPINIKFWPLQIVQIYVFIQIHVLDANNYTALVGTKILNAVTNFINALPIGTDVYNSWIYGAASLPNDDDGQTFVVSAVALGTAGNDATHTSVAIAFNQAAQCVNSNIGLVLV